MPMRTRVGQSGQFARSCSGPGSVIGEWMAVAFRIWAFRRLPLPRCGPCARPAPPQAAPSRPAPFRPVARRPLPGHCVMPSGSTPPKPEWRMPPLGRVQLGSGDRSATGRCRSHCEGVRMMPIRDMVLTLLSYPDPTPEWAIAAAAAIARQQQAVIEGALCIGSFPQVSNVVADRLVDAGRIIAEENARSRASGEAIASAFAETAGADAPLHRIAWSHVADPRPLAELARLFDLS